ncbi:DUF736 family protein [Bradyrhizobium sp. LLZ17]|uniref:DUF736 family protein n=1 Tax=Bradyrhizobium sp. LLZ17 TaxID=3239388 RepID=A0AB39XSU6_9BRAD
MIERGAPRHRSYVGQTKIARACLKRSYESRDYLSLKLDEPSFNVPPCATLLDDDGDDPSLLLRCGCKNWSRHILHHTRRRRRAGPREHGQACPCRAADANRT